MTNEMECWKKNMYWKTIVIGDSQSSIATLDTISVVKSVKSQVDENSFSQENCNGGIIRENSVVICYLQFYNGNYSTPL